MAGEKERLEPFGGGRLRAPGTGQRGLLGGRIGADGPAVVAVVDVRIPPQLSQRPSHPAQHPQGGIVDKVMFFITPKLLGGGKPVTDGRGAGNIKDAFELHNISIRKLGEDMVYEGYLR